jgi:hypothetical protein
VNHISGYIVACRKRHDDITFIVDAFIVDDAQDFIVDTHDHFWNIGNEVDRIQRYQLAEEDGYDLLYYTSGTVPPALIKQFEQYKEALRCRKS